MPHDSDGTAYERARAAFDKLSSEDQARFLMEKTSAAVSRGAKNVSRALADELENLFGQARGKKAGRSRADERDSRDEGKRGGPGPAQPPTDAQRASSGGPDV